MKKIMIMLALTVGTLSAFAQTKTTAGADSLLMDKSFEEAGSAEPGNVEYHLALKFYKVGELVPTVQAISLSAGKQEAVRLAKEKPTQLRRDCLNLIYTVDPIYSQGNITGAVRGTVVIKWEPKKRKWAFSYLKYQLINIDQSAQVFKPEIE